MTTYILYLVLMARMNSSMSVLNVYSVSPAIWEDSLDAASVSSVDDFYSMRRSIAEMLIFLRLESET